MKTLAVRFAFFMAFFLLKMRNALPTNGLEDFRRGHAVSPGHLSLFHQIAHRARANLRKQTPSKTEDMSDSANVRAHYEATLFHSIVSRSTNPRKFPKEPFKAQVLSNMKVVDEDFISKRIRRSLSQPQEGLGSHPRSSQSPSLTEPTPTLTETIKSSPVSGLPSYSSKIRSIYAHTSIRPLLSSQAVSSNSISASLDSLLPMSSDVTNRFQPASSKLSLKRSSTTRTLSSRGIAPLRSLSPMHSSTATHTPQVKPTQSSIYPLSSTAPTHQSSYPSISSSVDASDDSPIKSVRQKTRHKKKTPIPYWSIAASGIGCMFVILAGYLIWKLSGQTQRGNDTQGPLPDLPQGHDNPVYDRTSMIV